MNTLRLLVIGLAVLPVTVSAANTYVYGNVSSWTIRTDPAQSYRCFAEVQYIGGTSIRIGYNVDAAALYLRVTDPSWNRIRVDVEHEIEIGFDDGSSFELPGKSVESTPTEESGGVSITIPTASRQSFLQAFVARDTLTVSIEKSSPIELSLAGSARATRMLDECQASMARHATTAN